MTLQLHIYVLRVLICLTTINITILPALVMYWRTLRAVKVEPTFCYSEDDLSSANGNPDLLKQLIVLNDKNTDRNKHCGKLSDVLNKFVTQITANKYNSNAFPVRGQTTKVFWELSSNSGNIVRHVQEDGSIYVQKTGKYYISSQLTIKVENSTMPFDQNDQTVRHVVHMISFKEGTEKILLEHVRSMCEMADEHAEMTSNVEAIFHLEENDRIYVTTSHPYYIVSGSGSSHFSVHKV
ncbi:tumor necrosis factor ligand superfamily member 10-like isoform X3 [Mercenaria mercenaria]|uniref:tumor necrosis factor ligand superfamily member 10-like isoform X3 n=1 Tax=Mercenaria mercenaria TaxID=6596 RepID=UPI00234F54CE|nr:tumor necrosis factor ligand superfamily member 10-like isoform X3 [Mercenaria mercenaria]